MSKLKSSQRLAAIFIVVALVLAACGSDTGSETTTDNGVQDPDALSVVVTTTIWGDIVSKVTGGAANLEVLLQ